MQAVADKFHEEYPNIKVEVMAIPNEEYVTKLNTMATAGELPDCGIMNESGVLDFASDGLLYDISAMYEGADSMPLDSITFKSEGTLPVELERIFGITEGILRSIVIRHEDKKASKKAEKAEA